MTDIDDRAKANRIKTLHSLMKDALEEIKKCFDLLREAKNAPE